MGKMRKSFLGVANIIRFNWHIYLIALGVILLTMVLSTFSSSLLSSILQLISAFVLLSMVISLLVSWYIYDLTDFYDFSWIQSDDSGISVVNINAGFDETSELLKSKFKNATFLVLDFYDAAKHKEISIRRARKRYPPYPGTLRISSEQMDLVSHSVDKIFLILSAHEIRCEEERIAFFRELSRILKPTGQIFITEHLRDVANFAAYQIGALHFFSRSTWLNTFEQANLTVVSEIKNTPFISTFTLKKNGNTI